MADVKVCHATRRAQSMGLEPFFGVNAENAVVSLDATLSRSENQSSRRAILGHNSVSNFSGTNLNF